MKGMVFREFADMVESLYSPKLLDSLIARVRPASGGAYTSVGTYDYEELAALVEALAALVEALADATQVPVAQLLQTFGHHLAIAFSRKFGHFFAEAPHLFAFLQSVERHIHSEVLKLYPDAQLPRFEDEISDTGVLRMVYRSTRPLEQLALGLIEGSARHFAEEISISMQTGTDTQGRFTEFLITKRA